jgi:ribonuclease H2 subunit A
VLATGVNLKKVYVDTVGIPEKYKAMFEREFQGEGLEFTVESKADDTFPVVSAASICAKVTRDHGIIDWKYTEDFKSEE